MKRYIALTCEALARSVYAVAAVAPHPVSVRLFKQGLHNTPKRLRIALQTAIDAVAVGECDALLLVYGMCGMATVGLTARHTPLVIPRAHDCITLYLGSLARYQQEFDAHPGTYWYSLDYIEHSDDANGAGLGAINLGVLGEVYQTYVERYGRDNADYLMETMAEWGRHYDRAVYIDMDTGDAGVYEQIARDQASLRGWVFERKHGDRRLLELLLSGEWPADEFL